MRPYAGAPGSGYPPYAVLVVSTAGLPFGPGHMLYPDTQTAPVAVTETDAPALSTSPVSSTVSPPTV